MQKTLLLFLVIIAALKLNADAFTWNTPTTISTAGVNASSPQLVMDTNGNATAIWVENSIVTSSSLPFGGSWGSSTALSGAGGATPNLGVDSSGNVTAIWIEGGVVKTANQPFGSSWGSAIAISSTGASDAALAVDNAGNAVAVWVRNGFIETSTQLFGGSWGTVNVLSGTSSDNPAVSIGSNGTTVAVWHSLISGQDQILAAVSTIGGLWGTPSTVIAMDDSFNYPTVAVDNSGNAAAMFFSYVQSGSAYSNVFPLMSFLSNGATDWSIPVVLDDESFRNPVDLMSLVAFDADGNFVGLWTSSYDGDLFNVGAAKILLGKDCADNSPLVLQNVYAFQGDISVCPSGDTSSLYMIADSLGNLSIGSSDCDASAPYGLYWSIPVTASIGSENGYPRIATTIISGVVNAVGAWIYNDGSNNVIVASTGTRNVVSPPSSPGVVQSSVDRGVLTEYFNTVSWSASTDPNLQSYNIYRNGIFWIQVSAGASSIIDHNAVQNGSVTYGIAAVNNVLKQSAIVTVNYP